LCRFCCNKAIAAIKEPQLVYLCERHLEASKEKSVVDEYKDGKKIKS
jgi:hypothetical protein